MDETNVLDEMPAEEITQTEKKSRGGKHSKPGKNGRRGGKKSKKDGIYFKNSSSCATVLK